MGHIFSKDIFSARLPCICFQMYFFWWIYFNITCIFLVKHLFSTVLVLTKFFMNCSFIIYKHNTDCYLVLYELLCHYLFVGINVSYTNCADN